MKQTCKVNILPASKGISVHATRLADVFCIITVASFPSLFSHACFFWPTTALLAHNLKKGLAFIYKIRSHKIQSDQVFSGIASG